MKKFYVNVMVAVYADSAQHAKDEVRVCLNTGRGHIDGWTMGDAQVALTHDTNEARLGRVPGTPQYEACKVWLASLSDGPHA